MVVKIETVKNGPLKVEGDFSVHNSDDSLAPHKGTTAYLCRCGHSSNKPFCDGAHKKAEFAAN
jgi:CDGSH-type Zn-finger protein